MRGGATEGTTTVGLPDEAGAVRMWVLEKQVVKPRGIGRES
jgi:hypothetical protein